MTKYTNRLKARLAMDALRESAKEGKNWIITKGLILETEDENGEMGELEFQPGEVAEIGADAETGDLAIKGSAAVVVISDEDLASKIADVVTSADELSDVNFVDKPALDAIIDGESTEEVVDKLADGEDSDDIEVAEVEVEKKESVQNKFAKFAKHVINASKTLKCEAIQIDEAYNTPLNLATIKADRTMVENFTDHEKFIKRITEMKASIQPGEKEIVLSESNKVIGSFDTAKKCGILFLENEFETVEDMDAYDMEPVDLMEPVDFEMNDVPADTDEVEDEDMAIEDKVEACLKDYEESTQDGVAYMTFVEGLEKANLKEGVIAKIVSTFNKKTMTECCRVYDSKYGTYVKALSESVDADNFIAETKQEKSRFTKRFFG